MVKNNFDNKSQGYRRINKSNLKSMGALIHSLPKTDFQLSSFGLL